MTAARETPNRTIPHTIRNTPLIRASIIPTMKYTTQSTRAHRTAARAHNAVLRIFIAFMAVVFFGFRCGFESGGSEFLILICLSFIRHFFMRLSVVSVVSFQGLFGVEVRTYKVLTKNTSQPQDAGKIFRRTTRHDLVRP